MRVWGFGDTDQIPDNRTTGPGKIWYHLINSTGGYINYGENGIQRLDYAVSRSGKLGLKLVLPLMNYWSDWGGQLIYNRIFGYDYTWYEPPTSSASISGLRQDHCDAVQEQFRNLCMGTGQRAALSELRELGHHQLGCQRLGLHQGA